MAYSNAILYVDLVNGSDTARTAITGCTAANNGVSVVRITKNNHGLVTGAVINIPSSTYAGSWLINKIDANNFDLFSARANGKLYVTGRPAVNDSFVIGSQTFTFKSTRSTTGEVATGTTVKDTAYNIMNAVLTDITGQTVQYEPCKMNTIEMDVNTAVVYVYNLKSGTSGNTTTFTKSCANMTITGTGTLTGGTNCAYTSDRTSFSITPNGGSSWTDAFKTISATGLHSTRHLAGDVIRISKSPDPTNTGQNAIWYDNTREGGGWDATASTARVNMLIGSSTNATPIVITCNGHGFLNGDIVQIYGHSTNTAANGWWIVANKATNTFELQGSIGNGVGSATGNVWRQQSKGIVLTTAVTKFIDLCRNNWTGGTNVTSANYTSFSGYRTSDALVQIIVSATPTAANQIIAKHGLQASLDLSTFQQVSFWIRTNRAFASGDLLVKLYSDIACTSEVESLTVPAVITGNYFTPITINKGSNLSATVRGISIYSTVIIPAATNIYVDHFLACKSATSVSGITLSSMVSRNTAIDGGADSWYEIAAIYDKLIVINTTFPISNGSNYNQAIGGYTGTSGSTALYKRETFRPIAGTATSTAIMGPQLTGTGTQRIIYSFGWNPLSANPTQDGHTFLDGSAGTGWLFYGTTKNYITWERFSSCRFSRGIANSGVFLQFIGQSLVHCEGGGVIINDGPTYAFINSVSNNFAGGIAGGKFNYIQTSQISNNVSSVGVSIVQTSTLNATNIRNNSSGGLIISSNCIATVNNLSNNGNPGLTFNGRNSKLFVITMSYNALYPINFSNGPNSIIGATIDKTNVGNLLTTGTGCGELNMIDCTTTFTLPALIISAFGNDTRVYWKNLNGSVGNSRIDYDFVQVLSESTIRHTASGISWAADVNSGSVIHNPFRFEIAKVAVASSGAVTATVWVKKEHATNVSVRMFVQQKQLAGVTTDVYSTFCPNDTNWNQLSISFTPTEAGAITFELLMVNSSNQTSLNKVYVDDFGVTQV